MISYLLNKPIAVGGYVMLEDCNVFYVVFYYRIPSFFLEGGGGTI
jgi:hypothetical protein